MTIPRLNKILTEDHDRRDKLQESSQERKGGNSVEAAESLTRFPSALHRHLLREESILFPLFEQKTGQNGLTDSWRAEQEGIR